MTHIKQFDLVRLLKVDNVKWMSGPAGRPASPKGNWSVVSVIDGNCILAKDQTVVKIPITDIVLIASYDNHRFIDKTCKIASFDDIHKLINRKGK